MFLHINLNEKKMILLVCLTLFFKLYHHLEKFVSNYEQTSHQRFDKKYIFQYGICKTQNNKLAKNTTEKVRLR